MASLFGVFYRHAPANTNHLTNATSGLAEKIYFDFDKTKPDSFLIDPLSGAMVVADARIDNQQELYKDLRENFNLQKHAGTAEILLAAYKKWGTECGKHILGDFAFVVWDKQNSQIVCIRDVFGRRPLYYYLDDKRLVFASNLGALLKQGNIPVSVNDYAVGHYLTGRIQDFLVENTFYDSVYKVEPGHVVSISQSWDLHKQQYWQFSSTIIPYKSDAECCEAFHSLFSECVSDHLRVDEKIAITVSGGLDSTSVASRIAELDRCDYELFTIGYGQGNPADEVEYVEDLAEFLGVTFTKLDGQNYLPFVNSFSKKFQFSEPPAYWDYPVWDKMCSLIKQTGRRVGFTGISGDGLFLVQPVVFLDYLRRGRIIQAVTEYYHHKQNLSDRVVKILDKEILKLALPSSIKNLKKKTAPQDSSLNPDFFKRISTHESWNSAFSPDYGFDALHQNMRFQYLTRGIVRQQSLLQELGAKHGIEMRDPLGDRRLVQFALSLPPEQCLRQGVSKFLLREAMKNRLPESVRLRKDKTDFINIYLRGFNQWIEEKPLLPVEQWTSVKQGYIVANSLENKLNLAYKQMENGHGISYALARQLQRVVFLDNWLNYTLR